jgi:glycosyltransferase involved in cell wall biosynthesis
MTSQIMKVAIVHDYIKEYGGAERVLEALHGIYPDASIFTTVYLPEYLGPHRKRFTNWDIRTSFLQYFPFKAKLISPFRLLSSLAFKSFDFSGFDVIIVSATGAYFPNTLNKKSALQICYCHTPPRYLYGYATAREWKKNPVFRVFGEIANHFLRMVDFSSAQNVDYFIANSKEVQGRIKKFYRKEVTVIYPPVELNPKSEYRNSKQIQNSKPEIQNKAYYLAGGRLARAKHVDLIIEAFQKLDLPLKVFGKGFGGYEKELQLLADNRHSGDPSTDGDSRIDSGQARMTNFKIEFLGEVSDEDKFKLMKNAKAYIFAGEDEDFGILPVEAMSAGIAVIAYKSGGVKESMVDVETGLFFNELTTDSLINAVKRFEKMNINPAVCRKQAEKFSKERFKVQIKSFIKEALNNTNSK